MSKFFIKHCKPTKTPLNIRRSGRPLKSKILPGRLGVNPSAGRFFLDSTSTPQCFHSAQRLAADSAHRLSGLTLHGSLTQASHSVLAKSESVGFGL